jgi:hypothetical protein
MNRVVLALAAATMMLLHADTTVTFQNGVGGYTGSKDFSINTQYAEYNGGNGVTWRDTPELGCYTTTGSGSYAVRYLLKFDGLTVPAGSRVVSASLSLTFSSWNASSGNITGLYVRNSWNAASNRLGWVFRDDANSWASPGASSAGVDTISGKSFQVSALRPVGNQTLTMPLDVATVQSWIDTPAANQGIMLVNQNPGEIVRIISSIGTQNLRPKLTLVIASASGVQVSVSPSSATLQPGQTRQFTASVTGSSNTAVTWTATGGTVSTAGLFTAGATTGSFTVRATSVADTTKSATAQVTIQAAPPAVSVSLSPTSVTLQPGQTRQFAATVAGSTNTAVTWTATGGTVTTAGLFTAGAAAGAFTVRATSVADTTKSATAQVTIQAAPSVSVTISPANVTLQPAQTRQFTATVYGSTNTAVTWTATGGTVSTAGLFTAGTTTGNFTVRATSVADTTKSATAQVSIQNTQSLPPVPRQSDGAYVVTQSPVSGMRFTAPATIRIYADPHDGGASDPDALTVRFLLNGQVAGSYTGSGAQNGYFAYTATNLAAGTYVITTQITTTQNQVVNSFPVTVYVDNTATSTGPVFNLTSDVVLTGSQTAAYTGTASNHCLINGNGFRIRANAGFTGSLNISNCDIRNLGTATNPAIDVTVNGSGSIQLQGNVFDTFGTVAVGANDQAQLIVKNNEFRENTLVPVTSLPLEYSSATLPVFRGTGNSTAQKYFQGNNVGLSTVQFQGTRNWLIGGNTDADSNILMGVRCGFTINGSSNMVLRGNYSQHNYPHRFSQGQNFELQGGGFLAEHNVIRSSSWPVRGMGGELRYNLIDASGNSDQVFQAPMSNADIHHNVFTFTVSQTFYSPSTGLSLIYNVDNVLFRNNVMDGGGSFMSFYGNPVSVTGGSYIGSLRNNVFYNFASGANTPVISGAQGESTNPPPARLRYADYNDFYNPNAANQTNYGLSVIGRSPGASGYGQHDLGGFNGHVNPQFTQPTAIPFPFQPQDIWTRTKKVSDVLATYRSMYTPAAGSPLIGAGDPQDGTAINIGAVGNGEALDQFGRFGGGGSTPPPISVSVSPASTSVAVGTTRQFTASVTGTTNTVVNWTATGGTISASGLYTAGATAGSFVVTATSVQDPSKSASATVTVSPVTQVSVSISPTSATVQSGATRQFTATVTGTSNTSVTWSATGGTVSASGLYTAGTTAGSFSVSATSVQDPTKSASASITIPAPQPVNVTIAPLSTTLFTSGVQQFTATVSNAANTAVTWSATGGTVSSAGLYTAGTATGAFAVTATSVQDPARSATATVTITTPPANGAHPRIILDTPTLTALRSRAQSGSAEWTRLRSTCESYVGGSVQFINGNDYPNRPSVGEGYQGSGYFDALMPLGLCYQTLRQSDPTNAARYGAKGVAILMAMSDPANQTASDCNCIVPRRDYGYGIRFFGVTMGIGYDWFYELLTPAQRSQLQTALSSWINSFENDSFEYDHPQGNYFAGYYSAKCMAALAVQGDSPLGDTWWNAWYNHEHLQRVAPYYTANLDGGGWLEGFAQYGVLSSRNQALPALAVRTAKGIDIINNAAQPYKFPLDQAQYLMHFTWPTKDIIDDRGELYSTGDPDYWPGTGTVDIYRFFAGFLAMWGDPAAPMMQRYARDVKPALDAIGSGGTTDWLDFLFWNPAAPEAPNYSSLPLSFLAPGIGGVAARSDWSSTATFLSFVSGPYINNPSAGHEAFEKGSPAIQRNKNPLLVNPAAWMSHEPNGNAGWTLTYDDRFGNWDSNRQVGNRTLYNTFQVRRLDAQGVPTDRYGQWALQREDGVRTKIGRYEDGGSYVLSVGQFLEDMYRPFTTICPGRSPITSWSRQIVYLRPSQFVIYDRTGICDSSLDQYLAFHFAANPVEVAGGGGAGVRRFDVNTGSFAGSMQTVLPAGAAIATTDHLSSDTRTWNKLWRSEVRTPAGTPAAANRLWLTVFDAAGSASQVSNASPLNVTSGAAVGVALRGSSGDGNVVVSGTAAVGTAITGPLSYVVPSAASGSTRHVITDLALSAGYTVSVTVSGSTHTISIVPAASGGNRVSTANGVLSFSVSATGTIAP